MPHEEHIDPALVVSGKDVYRGVCVACEESFEIGPKALEWYRVQGFDIPKRCYRCRDARRRARLPDAVPWPTARTR
jgi:hypothetical protein